MHRLTEHLKRVETLLGIIAFVAGEAVEKAFERVVHFELYFKLRRF